MSIAIERSGELPPPTRSVIDTIREGKKLPILDVGPYLQNQPGALEQLAADVRAVQEGLGFYAVVNHRIEPALISEAVEETRRLFRLGEAERLRFRGGHHLQGYWPPASTGNPDGEFANEREKVGSLAGWAILRERTPNDPKVVAGIRHRTTNKWPDLAIAPTFKAAMLKYQAAMLDLAIKFLPVYALALGLPADYFDRSFKQPEWYLRCNYYQAAFRDQGGIAAVAHIDHSFLTLLPMSPIPGLQVRTHDKHWIDVAYIEDAIIINTGEWLSQLSNGRFLATPHRVTQPDSERITLPLFFDPDDEMRNDPIPTAAALTDGRSFPRRSFHEHFVAYMASHYKAEAPKEQARTS